MHDATLPTFELSASSRVAGGDRSVRKRFERGELTRLRSGVYLPTQQWLKLSRDAQYRVRVAASASIMSFGTQFSHDSAAALWRLPSIGPWSSRVHALSPAATGGRSSPGLVRHGLGLDPRATELNCIGLTSLARTVVDASCSAPFNRAVGMIDDALRAPAKGEFRHSLELEPVTNAELLHTLEALYPYKGSTRALRALEFASGLSGSIGESLSRCQFHYLGFPPPMLQVPFYDEDGLIGYADFYWPELDAIGEFDGNVKYLGETYRRGQLPEEVVLNEKKREDRMRRVVRAFGRWDWTIARDPARLAQRLRPLGLMPIR